MEELEKAFIDEIADDKIESAIRNALDTIRKNCDIFTEGMFPSEIAPEGFYDSRLNEEWTSGFWVGELWLAAKVTGDLKLKSSCQKYLDSFVDRIENKSHIEGKNLALLFSPVLVNQWNDDQNPRACEAAVKAADVLMSSYQEKGSYFPSYRVSKTNPRSYSFTPKDLMNNALLYWVAEKTGKSEYSDAADKFTTTFINNCIRPDGSVYERFYMSPVNGNPIAGSSNSELKFSVLSLSQAWALFALAISYRYSHKEEFLKAFRIAFTFYKASVHILSPVPKADLIAENLATDEHEEDDEVESSIIADSSLNLSDTEAASIIICSLLHIAGEDDKNIPKDEIQSFRRNARRMMSELCEKYAVTDYKLSNGLLRHGDDTDPMMCTICGDYFYLEALYRLSANDYVCW